MNPENIYFFNTPIQVQDDCYDIIIEQLEQISSLKEEDIIYLIFTPIFNLSDKGFFKVYVSSQVEVNKDFDREPDFIIFIK